MEPKFTIPGLHAYLAEVFPELAHRFEILSLRPLEAEVRMAILPGDLRPGGTVSGPAMFALADCSFYIAVLAMIGREPLAVTTSCALDFMRRPGPGAMIAQARILKLGRSLAVGDVLLFSEGVDGPVARGSFTYSIPPARGSGTGADNRRPAT